MASQQVSHYRIIERLGAGGMGEVFLAHDLKLERKVAIKMLPAKSIDDALARKRLFREAKAAATLSHPNICTIHEVNEEGECPFIVMQYVEGITLASKLLETALSPEEVIDVAVQVAEALSEAHSRGVIHRDIKPQNVIINARGQVKVLDFGLARLTPTEQSTDPEAKTETQLTEEGYIVGTVAYMSPEQLKGQPIDARSDIFSMGVMLYECATGKAPFRGTSKIEISSKVLQVDPLKPSQLTPGIPPALEHIIIKALAKDVEERYQSADAILADLKDLRASLSGATALMPSVSRHAPAPSRTGISAQALRSRWLLIAVIAVPLLVFATWVVVRLSRAKPYEPGAAAKPYYDAGIKAIRAGTYFQAASALKQSVDLDREYAPAHSRLAEAYLEIGNTEPALGELLVANQLAANRALASDEKLYLDAINATATRNFKGAIDLYQRIVNQASAADKAYSYVDLGHAYERDEQLDKAIENYTQATKLDSQSPAAFMRLGIAYGRRRNQKTDDLKNAGTAFNEAERIYLALSDREGQVEVVFQRGMLFYGSGHLPEARTQLEKAQEMAKSVDNDYQRARSELELSLVYRDQGDTARAKQSAEDAVRIAQNSDIKNVAINGLIDLGLAFMTNGSFDDAANYFQQALDLAQRANSDVGSMRAHLSFGRLYFLNSDNDKAIAELQQALDFYRQRGYRRETSMALTLLGRAHQDKGEDDLALKYFKEQFDVATQASDQLGVGDSHMSFAFLVGVNQENYPEALTHLDEKLKIDELLNNDRGKGFTQMNRGRFLWQLGRYDEAAAALNAAFEIANRPEAQNKAVLAWVHLIRSRIALSQSQYGEAKKEAQAALELSDKFPDVAVEAKSVVGLAQAYSGSSREGRKLCDEAITTALATKSRSLINSIDLMLAEVALLDKDAATAKQTALEAQKVFAQSGQQDSEWRALLIAARASQAAGDKVAAQDYAARAEIVWNALQQKWGVDGFQSYLRRPDIQMYRKQLTDLRSGK